MIATPTKVQAFQVPLDGPCFKIGKHHTDECGTTYPPPENNSVAQNPITGR